MYVWTLSDIEGEYRVLRRIFLDEAGAKAALEQEITSFDWGDTPLPERRRAYGIERYEVEA